MGTRMRIVVAGLFVAIVPFAGTAHADTLESANAAVTGVRANWVNDLARCRLAAMGVAVPGNVAFSQPTPAGLFNDCMPLPGASSAGSTSTQAIGAAGCLSTLTKFQQNIVNEWAISVQKANANKTPEPAMPSEVMALIGAC